jgi:hypothetical protein
MVVKIAENRDKIPAGEIERAISRSQTEGDASSCGVQLRTTGTELWFIVSPMTFCLLSMATYMPIQFFSGRYPIR